jgi:hypothetical protein
MCIWIITLTLAKVPSTSFQFEWKLGGVVCCIGMSLLEAGGMEVIPIRLRSMHVTRYLYMITMTSWAFTST